MRAEPDWGTRAAWLVATVGGVGRLRPAPGTWGSLVTVPAVLLVHLAGGFPALVAGIVLATAAGWWATRRATRDLEDPDLPEIVIDEVAGQALALAPLSLWLWIADAPALAPWTAWLAAFALFRALDILKPGAIGRADRRGDALGVMLDDIIAGLAAGPLALGLAVALSLLVPSLPSLPALL